ncbi:unnamed protein product, partial [Heligmosomoides polygyrus]|uniref:T-complex protein 1 subunit theta n=1 Tax=Heligmosomoides polygyrus TaxID=6339 RepID=A0A183GVG0_HELPZ
MAMNIPKSGYNRFMKEGAQHFKGTDEAVLRNTEACVELASQLRSAYGPNGEHSEFLGMNKMVINHIEKLFVTNDAATVLKELDVQHPAAKIIIMASQMQEKQVGDNTNTVVILAAALLEHAAQLISMGLTPQEVAAGYEQAAEKALEILPTLVIKEATDFRDASMVKKFLRSAITSKQYDNEETIAELVSKACVLTVPKNSFNFNVDNIRICKILGSGVNTSLVMNGMVFKRGAEGEVKSVQNARVAVFTCPFDLTQTETKGTVLIENAEELMGFAKGEESEVENQVKALADSGVQVAFPSAVLVTLIHRTPVSLGSGVNTSLVMNGMVFKRGAEGEVKSVQNARVAVFTCPFDLTQTETKGTVLIENAEELMGFAKGEESEVENQVKALADS